MVSTRKYVIKSNDKILATVRELDDNRFIEIFWNPLFVNKMQLINETKWIDGKRVFNKLESIIMWND